MKTLASCPYCGSDQTTFHGEKKEGTEDDLCFTCDECNKSFMISLIPEVERLDHVYDSVIQ